PGAVPSVKTGINERVNRSCATCWTHSGSHGPSSPFDEGSANITKSDRSLQTGASWVAIRDGAVIHSPLQWGGGHGTSCKPSGPVVIPRPDRPVSVPVGSPETLGDFGSLGGEFDLGGAVR